VSDDRQSFVLVSDKVRANAIEAVRNAPADYAVTVAPRTRSNDQNAMFHAICTDIAKCKFPFAGKPRPAKVWKVLLISAHAAATDEGNEVVPGLEGEFVNIRESSALMSVKRAASLITYTLAFCDTNGIPLNETRRGGFFDEQRAA
jgi:hypothetical protein